MMIDAIKESLWKQFGASIDMLKNAIALWPDEDWDTDKRFFYNAYHCLVFLDYYLTSSPINFTSKLPFTLAGPGYVYEEGMIDDVVPDRIYTKTELLDYAGLCRDRCRNVIAALTEEKLAELWIEEQEDGRTYVVLELLMYNMRHVQHHAAQLNMLLRQKIDNAPRWVSRTKDEV